MNYPQDFEDFWQYYGETSTQKGSKRTAFKSWEKVAKQWCKEEQKPADAFANHVRAGHEIVLQNRHIARKNNDFVAQMPHASTWLNQYRFEEEKDKRGTRLANSAPQATEYVCDECQNAFAYPGKGQRTEENCITGRSEKGGYICAACLPKTLNRFGDVGKDFYQRHKGDMWGSLLRGSMELKTRQDKIDFMQLLKAESRKAGGFGALPYNPSDKHDTGDELTDPAADLTKAKLDALRSLGQLAKGEAA